MTMWQDWLVPRAGGAAWQVSRRKFQGVGDFGLPKVSCPVWCVKGVKRRLYFALLLTLGCCTRHGAE